MEQTSLLKPFATCRPRTQLGGGRHQTAAAERARIAHAQQVGLYSGSVHDGVYHEIRHRSFETHPLLGHVPQPALMEVAFRPLSQVEQMFRRIPAFVRAR